MNDPNVPMYRKLITQECLYRNASTSAPRLDFWLRRLSMNSAAPTAATLIATR